MVQIFPDIKPQTRVLSTHYLTMLGNYKPGKSATHARAHVRPSFHPTWLPDFYLDQFVQAATLGTVGKSLNLGEETPFSCLCSNSILKLRIASRDITKVIPVSIKNLERDRMSGCMKENKQFESRKHDLGEISCLFPVCTSSDWGKKPQYISY